MKVGRNMNKIVMKIGDYSNDGHGRMETIKVLVNCTIQELRKLYEEVVKESKIYFGGLERESIEDSDYNQVCNNYEDSFFNVEAIGKNYRDKFLKKFDKEDYDEYYGFYMESDGDVYIEGAYGIVSLMMEFIKFYNSNFSYKILDEDDELIFNPWGTDFIGYGLF